MDKLVTGPVKKVLDSYIAFLNGQGGGNEQNPVYDGIKNILVEAVAHNSTGSNLFRTFSFFGFAP